ncbi:MAG: flagellar biosynthesis protein FlhF [Gallionellales bacterium GWA2_60_18]|nr:MAG: flagellar biosynthesis protein FlhF [Gallionellales bacterium GWA2_60_18]
MNIRKFIAPTARQALKDIRSELGDSAVILSNRKVAQGVEIIALANEEITQVSLSEGLEAGQEESSPLMPPQLKGNREVFEKWSALSREGRANAAGKPSGRTVPEEVGYGQPDPVPQAEPQPASGGAQCPILAPQSSANNILDEIKSMHAMLQQQIAALFWTGVQQRDPQRSGLLRRMINAGFSTLLARKLLDKMPAGKEMEGERWIKQVLKRNLRVAEDADDIVVKGGVYALIGPTGVGKTTTTAKLAARAVVRYGADKVALLTTDSYRIGAYEQLKIYGKILGVAVHAVKDTDDLRLTLSALRHKHLVLIDTVGMGQRDERVGDQNEMFNATGVQRLLLLNATSSGDTLDDVVRMYNSDKVIGCIPTKLDEAVSLGPVLDVAVRYRLMLHYITNGQRVPENLHVVNLDYLLHRALKPVSEKSPFMLNEAELPSVMTGIHEASYAQ